MSDATIIFFLSVCIVVLICIVLYQQFAFRTGTQGKLKKIGQKLEEIQDTDSDENVMVFTDNKVLMDLAAQINRLLENQRKVKVDFRRSEIASKKMLSNISHDIKTPMTVILGYLEIMRLNGSGENEMLLKVEQTGVACHTGNYTCFYTPVKENGIGAEMLGQLQRIVEDRKEKRR